MNLDKRIKWTPELYMDAAVIAQEAEAEMLDRLQWMTIKPSVVIDVGCGAGQSSHLLQQRYPDACVIAIDHCFEMINYTEQHAGVTSAVCADAYHLPLRSQSVDLVFANFLLPWTVDRRQLFQEWRRILRPHGLLMFTALGPDTINEIYKDVNPCLQKAISPQFIDMHDIGDGLLAEKFLDPVLDVTHFTTVYRNSDKLFTDLTASGMLIDQLSADMLREYKLAAELELTYEVIFAHAFAPADMHLATANDGVVNVPLDQFREMLIRKKGSD